MKPTTRVTLIAVIFFMARGIMIPVSSLYASALGANYVMIGMLGTLVSATMILASYAWGRASDRVGQRKGFLLIGLAILVAVYAGTAAAPDYRYLFPLYILGAVAQSAYDTSSLALMGDLLESRANARGRRMGTYRGLASLGFGLMAFMSGSVADAFSLRVPSILAAGLFGVSFLLALGISEAPPEKARPRSGPTLSETTPLNIGQAHTATSVTLPLWPLLIAAFLWSLVVGAVYAVWANYMVEDLHYSQAQMSRLWALASLSEFPLMILAGWLSDRLGRLWMLSLGFLTWTLVFVGYLAVPLMPWIVLVQLTRGFAYSAHTATAMTYAAEVRSREHRGRASGLYSTAGSLGAVLGASMGGLLVQFLGFRVMIGVSAALIFGGALYLAVTAWSHHTKVDL